MKSLQTNSYIIAFLFFNDDIQGSLILIFKIKLHKVSANESKYCSFWEEGGGDGIQTSMAVWVYSNEEVTVAAEWERGILHG